MCDLALDGTLRIQGCDQCDNLVHLPATAQPHGGQLSEVRTHGMAFFYEAVAQLRHEAGARQVQNANTAIVATGRGTPSGVMILQRDGT
jgi:hypothetical protein